MAKVIGTAPYQVPTNADLGTLAFQDAAAVSVDLLQVDNLLLDVNTISSTNTNGDINITPNGTGSVVLSKATINNASIGATTAATLVNVGNLSLATNTLSSVNTNGNINITPNGTGSVVLSKATVSSGTIDNVSIGSTTAASLVNVGNLSLTTNTLSSTNTNGNITLAPNGTGDVYLDADTVRIGDANTAATLTTNGTGNLTLTTNSGTNSGSITINQGIDGNIALNPNGAGLVQIGTSLYISGNLTVIGTTTSTSSTTISVSDPVITLGGSTSTPEVSKDRGVEFKYNGITLTITNYIGAGSAVVTGTVASTSGYAVGDIITISGATGTEQTKLNGTWTIASVPTSTTFTFVVGSTVTAGTLTTNLGTTVKSKNGFFGLKQSTGKFTFIPQSLNTAQVFTGTAGTITAADIQIKDYSINASMWSRSFALMGA